MHRGSNSHRSVALIVLSLLLLFPGACRRRPQHPSERQGRDAAAAVPSSAATANPEPAATAQPLACPRFLDGNKLGRIQNDELTEASDLVVSEKNPGVIWSHNDSGGKARIFALTTSGRDLGTYHLEDTTLVDWEDMSTGPGPESGEPYLYIGDIGANNKTRKHVSVYRVKEPKVDLDQKPKKRKLGAAEQFEFSYPDRISYDAESLMVDPITGDVFLVTKSRQGPATFYRRKAPLDAHRTMSLEKVADFAPTGAALMLPTLVTSADISRDGSMLLVRTYSQAYLWPRHAKELIDVALSRPPCPVPLHSERQGESIAFAPNGKGYYTVSEGSHPAIYFFEQRD